MRKEGYGLNFFDDTKLYTIVDEAISRAQKGGKAVDLWRNGIDPFYALFERIFQDLSYKEWEEGEKIRQSGKTLSNAIGNMHQSLLAELPGWKNTGSTGGVVDLIHEDPWGKSGHPVVAEVKNKHNTMNASDQRAIYDNLGNTIASMNAQRNLTASSKGSFYGYLIVVIPRSKDWGKDQRWNLSQRGTQDAIRRISAENVYEIATGDKDAFSRLYEVLPLVMSDVLGKGDSGTSPDWKGFFHKCLG